MENETLLALTADIVAAHVANNHVAVSDVAGLVGQVHAALAGLAQAAPEENEEKKPVVSVRASIKPDYLICMECGRKQTTLKRHLQAAHGMTPDQYRTDYGLPRDYPMVAPDYSKRRSEMAFSIGLGQKRTAAAAAPAAGDQPAKTPGKRGRKPKAAADQAASSKEVGNGGADDAAPPAPKRRGRPPRAATAEAAAPAPAPAKRGRPRKNKD